MKNIEFTSIHLIGLIMPNPESFVESYFKTLPVGFTKCQNFKAFYRLKKGRRNFTKENLEPFYDMEYLVYSPTSKLYYYKLIHEYTNMNRLLSYFEDGNVYILDSPENIEENINKSEEEDYILF